MELSSPPRRCHFVTWRPFGAQNLFYLISPDIYFLFLNDSEVRSIPGVTCFSVCERQEKAINKNVKLNLAEHRLPLASGSLKNHGAAQLCPDGSVCGNSQMTQSSSAPRKTHLPSQRLWFPWWCLLKKSDPSPSLLFLLILLSSLAFSVFFLWPHSLCTLRSAN